jgi:mono/diheme cytochrome c family protein
MIRTAGLAMVVWALMAGGAAAQTPAAIEHGRKVFASEKCGVCHSVAGVGNKKGPLDEIGTKLTAAEIREWIVSAPEMTAKTKAARKPLMKSYPNIVKEDLDALVAYLQSLKKKA